MINIKLVIFLLRIYLIYTLLSIIFHSVIEKNWKKLPGSY